MSDTQTPRTEPSLQLKSKIDLLSNLGYDKDRFYLEYFTLNRAAEVIVKDIKTESSIPLTVRSFYKILEFYGIRKKTKAEMLEGRSQTAKTVSQDNTLQNLESIGLDREGLAKLYEIESIKGIVAYCVDRGLTKVYKSNVKDLLEFYNIPIDSSSEAYAKAAKKSKSTCLEKYGVDNVAKVPEVVESSKRTVVTSLLVSEGHEPNALVDKTLDELLEFSDGRFFTVTNRKAPVFTNSKYSRDELVMRDILKSLGVSESDYKRNDRTILNPFEIDFLLPDLRLGIEVNPIWTHSYAGGFRSLSKMYHQNKLIRSLKSNVDLVSWFTFDSEAIITEVLKRKISESDYSVKDESSFVEHSFSEFSGSDLIEVSGNHGRQLDLEKIDYAIDSFVDPESMFVTRSGEIVSSDHDKALELYDCGKIVYSRR